MTELKNKGFIEVLSLISGYSEVEKQTILINDEVEITGTLSDFKSLRKELNDDSKDFRTIIYDLEAKINQPISSIEVYNYFRELTNGFSAEETRITLAELNCFREMVLEEELNHLAKLEYHKNNWPIPTYSKTGKLGIFEFEDVEKMRKKVFPANGFLFYEAISLLRSKVNSKPLEDNSDTNNNLKPTMTLSKMLSHESSIQIVNGIKTSFKYIKGKRLKLLLLALQELNLIPKERIAKAFHNCCKKEFDWDIASYTAMNDYTYNDYSDKKELFELKETIKTIINQK